MLEGLEETLLDIKITGFEKLSREFNEASEALASVNGEIARLKFNCSDPVDVQRAIGEMERAIDEKVGRHKRNDLVRSLAAKMKEQFRQQILQRASAKREVLSDSDEKGEMMNHVVDRKRKQRFEYMNALYESAGGREQKFFNLEEVGKEIGFSGEESEAIVEYLHGEGLVRTMGLAGLVSITHLGVMEVEAALQKPDQATQHFPPIHNTINIQSMAHSVIQQGTISSTVGFSMLADERARVETFLAALKEDLKTFALSEDEAAETRAEIATVEAQLNSPKPKTSIIGLSLKFLTGVAEKVAASPVAPHVTSALPAIHHLLSHH